MGVKAVNATVQKTCRNARDLWKIVFYISSSQKIRSINIFYIYMYTTYHQTDTIYVNIQYTQRIHYFNFNMKLFTSAFYLINSSLQNIKLLTVNKICLILKLIHGPSAQILLHHTHIYTYMHSHILVHICYLF